MSKIEDAKADYLAGMKYKDIAKKYEVALSTVKSWKTRNKWQRNNATQRKSMHTKQKSTRTKREKVAPSLPSPELPNNDELTDKQRVFCLYYLQRYNATWAYQKAYGGNYETALRAGPRLLGNVGVKNYLAELKKQQSQDLYATANDILLRYLKQATSDVTDVLSFKTKKRLVYYKIHDKNGPYEDAGGKFRYEPKIDPETGEQAYYYEHLITLKDSEDIDTSNIKSIRIDKGEPVVEMEDRQKAMQILLDRLPEPEVSDDSTTSLLRALKDGMDKIWSKNNEDN
ncbi:terminase small subunit [Lactobacillus johnsonii]|uniref:terminase small subunit n=1 Tax=Lactobacillus johnsonii TaxID=33959 RepID=UPI001F568B30|nr:terminase small subunit [Lactobacillus johnsonii]UNL59720.1 terminase [Lactobacillus johnsonii]